MLSTKLPFFLLHPCLIRYKLFMNTFAKNFAPMRELFFGDGFFLLGDVLLGGACADGHGGDVFYTGRHFSF